MFPSKLADAADLVGNLSLIPGPATGPPRWGDVSRPFEAVMRIVRTRRLPGSVSPLPPLSERMRTGEHQPIAYRAERFRLIESDAFWISSNPGRAGSTLALALSPFLVHWARFEAHDALGTVLLFNAHFGHAPWHHRATARIALAEIGAIVGSPGKDGARTAANGPASVFLAGDFNAVPSSALLRGLAGPAARFVDAARTAPQRAGPPVTYHWGTGTVRLGLTLDHVLSQSFLRPARAEVVAVREGRLYPSDHHPLVVEFADPTRDSSE